MAIIEIDVDEDILKEAERALESIGMDVKIAVNIFLRKAAIANGFPLPMTAPKQNQEEFSYSKVHHTYPTRSNNNITKDMVDEVWRAFLKHHKGLGEIRYLSDEVSENSGMNRGSAFIYLTILSKLIKGASNTRTLKFKDLEYLMGKVKSELLEEDYQNAIKSLKQSILYWREKIPGTFADNVEALCS